MAGRWPTALEIADTLKYELNKRNGSVWDARISKIRSEGWKRDKLGPGLEIRAFDMTLRDGRVYRVRVSDITPEGYET